MNKEELITFEKYIAHLYDKGKIKFPIHLSGGNEKQLIDLFKKYNIKQTDWILSTWRNHYHWLLSGRTQKDLKEQIINTGSMPVYDKYFFTSAIVGGIAPIAVGLAMALKMKKSKQRVFCFLGCMASRCGIVKESIAYAEGHDLPVIFIIEDNDESVYTCTSEVWGKNKTQKVVSYSYKKSYKHHGTKLRNQGKNGLF